ncbi:MAG: hypothetical protein ACTHJR_17490 [Sphingomonas sp.]|uniref:hypothetical protein n=1 Tax=Sphingomonas sp. TaxID=28214 RepID=UPI003F7E39F6
MPTIVRYLDSGLPVILGLANIADDRRDGHALTAVGYVEAHDAVREGKSYDCFVRALVVHDDQRGPYRLMALTADDVAMLPAEQLLCVDGNPIMAAVDVTHIFVPLSPRVVRLGDHADLIAREFVRRIAEHGDKFTGALKELPVAAIDRLQSLFDLDADSGLVFRTYLTTAARYRHHLAATRLPEDVKIRAINRELPHFIWVVELLDRNAIADAVGKPRPLLGHVVINATSAIENETDLLFAHLPHLDFQRDVNPGNDAGDFVDHFTAVSLDNAYAQRLRR